MSLAEIHRDRTQLAVNEIAWAFTNPLVRLDCRYDRALAHLQILRYFDTEAWWRGHKWVEAYMECVLETM